MQQTQFYSQCQPEPVEGAFDAVHLVWSYLSAWA